MVTLEGLPFPGGTQDRPLAQPKQEVDLVALGVPGYTLATRPLGQNHGQLGARIAASAEADLHSFIVDEI